MKRIHLSALALGAMLVLLSAPALSALAADAADDPIARPGTETLSAAERTLLDSSAPKVITTDPETGELIAVRPMTSSEAAASAPVASTGISSLDAYYGGCSAGRGCWYGTTGIGSEIGFTTGKTSGNWNNRRNFFVPAKRYAKLCWRNPGDLSNTCHPERYGDNAWIEFGSIITGRVLDMKTTRD